jgi:hypothetical protein
MTPQALTVELSQMLALPETELLHKGLLALVEKEIRAAENEIAQIRERYDVFTKEAFIKRFKSNGLRAIQRGKITLCGKTKKRISPNYSAWRKALNTCWRCISGSSIWPKPISPS